MLRHNHLRSYCLFIGLLLIFCAHHVVTGSFLHASTLLVRSYQRRLVARKTSACYGTVISYTTTSKLPSPQSDAMQTSTSSYLDSLSRNHVVERPSQSSSADNTSSNSQPSTVPMDTPARQSLPAHLALHPFPNKGLGVVTTIPISKGEFIGEYKGEIFTEEVKDRRYLPSKVKTAEDEAWIQSRIDRGQFLTGCYVYGITIPPTRSNNFEMNQRIYVDAEDEYESLWTRFLNHARPPNNNCNPKSVHESYNGEPRVWFVASRDIEVGEELCFDYGDDYWLEGDDVV